MLGKRSHFKKAFVDKKADWLASTMTVNAWHRLVMHGITIIRVKKLSNNYKYGIEEKIVINNSRMLECYITLISGC